MKIERFEDIQGWQKARKLARLVYQVTSQGAFARDFRLRDQIQDAAGSVMANVAEGFDGGSDVEFIRFLRYARRSASEVQSHLYLALDQGYIAQAQFDAIYETAAETKRLIGGFIRYLQSASPQSSVRIQRSKAND
jgi:four helix bundle protein